METKIEEIWKDVVGYEGFYKVSNLGRVRRLQTKVNNCLSGLAVKKERILKGSVGHLYYNVCLSIASRRKTHNIHSLVAVAFIPNPLNLPQVNHIDGNKLNNAACNLEWVTPYENIQHAIKNNLIKNNSSDKLLTKGKIEMFIRLNMAGYTFTDISNIFKVHKSTVGQAIRGNKNYRKVLNGLMK